MEVAGGRKNDTPFYLEVVGEKGSLRLDGGAPRGLQSGGSGLSRMVCGSPSMKGSSQICPTPR